MQKGGNVRASQEGLENSRNNGASQNNSMVKSDKNQNQEKPPETEEEMQR